MGQQQRTICSLSGTVATATKARCRVVFAAVVTSRSDGDPKWKTLPEFTVLEKSLPDIVFYHHQGSTSIGPTVLRLEELRQMPLSVSCSTRPTTHQSHTNHRRGQNLQETPHPARLSKPASFLAPSTRDVAPHQALGVVPRTHGIGKAFAPSNVVRAQVSSHPRGRCCVPTSRRSNR